MKKWLKASVGILTIVGMLSAGTTAIAAAKTTQVFIDGQLQQDVITVNGRTMAQLIAFNDPDNLTYSYEQATKTVVISSKTKSLEVRLKAGDGAALVNGKSVKLDAPVTIKNGRTYLPLRFLAETLGGTVAYNTEAKRVIIRTPSGEEQFNILMSGDLVQAREIAIQSGTIHESKVIEPYGEGFTTTYTFPKGEALRFLTEYKGLVTYKEINSEGLAIVKYQKDTLGHNGEAGKQPAAFPEAVYFTNSFMADLLSYGTIDNEGKATKLGEINFYEQKEYANRNILPIEGEARIDAR